MTRDTTVPTFSEHVRFRDIEGRQLERFDRWVERSEHAAMFLEPVPEQPMASARKSEADDAPLTLEPNIVRMRDIWKEQLEQKAEEALDIMERDNLLALFDAPDGLVDFKAVTRLSGVNTLGTMTARERLADTGLFVRGRQELLKSDTWTLTELVTSFMLNPNQENLFNLIIADSNRRDEALKIINETIQRRLDARIRP